MTRLVILSPIYKPTPGGASTYYEFLSRQLLESGIVRNITIITENVPGELPTSKEQNDRLKIIRLFPHRAGGSLGKAKQYIRYLRQNLSYYSLRQIISDEKPNWLLVHSSFHNYPNLMTHILRNIGQKFSLIADVRDKQLPKASLRQLDVYDHIIACSEGVKRHLDGRASLRDKTVLIPVPHEEFTVPPRQSVKVPPSATDNPNGFLLYAGLLKAKKGVELLLDSYSAYRSINSQPMDLVIVGASKSSRILRRAQSMTGVHLLGPQDRTTLLHLIGMSNLVINLSESEGMPRICLEALSLGKRVILPKAIPEFAEYCADWVAAGDDPYLIANQIQSVLRNAPPSQYPLRRHRIDATLPQYASLFSNFAREENG